MIEFTRIVVPIDYSESSTRALTHAEALARWYDAKLLVLHVATIDPLLVQNEFDMPVYGLNLPTPDEVVVHVRQFLDTAGISHDAVPIAGVGDPANTIISEVVRNKADLIVMGTHGRRGFKRLLLGSVTERVLREAPCPVLTVPPATPAERSKVVTFKRILCANDFSPSARLALEFALDLARQSDGTVTVLHAIEWLAEEAAPTTAQFNVPEFRRHLFEDSQKALHDLIATESQTWSRIETEVVFGRAYREILRAAEIRQSELIVMGAQGRGGLDLSLFGSATQQVVRGASCPVLTVRERSRT